MLETTLLANLATIVAALLVGGLFGVVVWKITTGEISLAYLLSVKNAAGRWEYSPARLQLLLFTLAVAASYLQGVIANPKGASLPDMPPSVLAVLAGSQAVYLGGKAFSTFVQPLLKKLE
jgi:hypothetical protein